MHLILVHDARAILKVLLISNVVFVVFNATMLFFPIVHVLVLLAFVDFHGFVNDLVIVHHVFFVSFLAENLVIVTLVVSLPLLFIFLLLN